MQIRINLLPPEYRKKEMTPLVTLLPALVAFTLVLGGGAFWAWNHFGALARVRSENEQLQQGWATRKAPLEYLGNLRSEESDYAARSKTIAEIATSRVPWTLKLNQFCDLVADDDGGDRYLVWLSDFQVKKPQGNARRTKTKVGESIAIEGLCFSDEHPLNRFNQFHEALQQHAFFADCTDINNPAGQAVLMEDELLPSRAWTIKLDMQMKAREPKRKGSGLQADAKSK
ncbi:MAG: hypothetical protein HRU14_06575 [Planctomycetes bacterium]|nr:hypothetical protein [Planctomycetota bacterium]